MGAAAAGIQLARTAYLPGVDGLAQVIRAARNKVFGLLLPQSVIPSISGPVLGTNKSTIGSHSLKRTPFEVAAAAADAYLTLAAARTQLIQAQQAT